MINNLNLQPMFLKKGDNIYSIKGFFFQNQKKSPEDKFSSNISFTFIVVSDTEVEPDDIIIFNQTNYNITFVKNCYNLSGGIIAYRCQT